MTAQTVICIPQCPLCGEWADTFHPHGWLRSKRPFVWFSCGHAYEQDDCGYWHNAFPATERDKAERAAREIERGNE